MSAPSASTVCGTKVVTATDDDRAVTCIVSDLHIPEPGGAVLAAFERLVTRVAELGTAGRLWILGDLFDAWVGRKQLASVAGHAVATALAAAARAGVAITVLHGNRDYLLDHHFAAAAGVRVVAGGLRARLGSRRVLALHGDELCRRDLPYQRAKRLLRNPGTKLLVRSLPLRLALALSGSARKRSGMVIRAGDQTRFDPTAAALGEVFAADVDLLLFGHIHRPARGWFAPGREYCILPAFDQDGIALRHDTTGLRYLAADGTPLADFPPRTFC